MALRVKREDSRLNAEMVDSIREMLGLSPLYNKDTEGNSATICKGFLQTFPDGNRHVSKR